MESPLETFHQWEYHQMPRTSAVLYGWYKLQSWMVLTSKLECIGGSSLTFSSGTGVPVGVDIW